MLDRRSFLTGGAATVATVAGVAGAGLLGACAQNAPAPATPEGSPMAATGPSDEARAVTLVEREADVADKVAETLECDIVVLGGGAGGLGAAVKAAQLGARVILLEKASELGGSLAMTSPPARPADGRTGTEVVLTLPGAARLRR